MKNEVQPRWRKLLGEALADPGRAFLVAMAIVRGWLIKGYYHIHRPGRVLIGRGFRAFCRLDIRGPGKVVIGPRFCCARTMLQRPKFITHVPGAKIEIGRDNYFGGTQISCLDRVTIGDKTLLSNVLIMDSDIMPGPATVGGANKARAKAIHIGDRCWLGMNTIVLSGVTLGEECVLSAGSVANKSQEPFSLLMGNPARRIGSTRSA